MEGYMSALVVVSLTQEICQSKPSRPDRSSQAVTCTAGHASANKGLGSPHFHHYSFLLFVTISSTTYRMDQVTSSLAARSSQKTSAAAPPQQSAGSVAKRWVALSPSRASRLKPLLRLTNELMTLMVRTSTR